MSAIATVSRWDDAPLGELIDHIVTAYHQPLLLALARLRLLARRGLGAAPTARLDEWRELLFEHTRREEELVFPWLRRPNQLGAGILVNLLEQEHGDSQRRVRELRDLVDGRAPASRTVRALSAGLRELEVDLAEHIRLENCVLFPRALADAGHD